MGAHCLPNASEPRSIIVVPCYNEGARLKSEEFLEFARRNAGIHFLFVNDGSSDNTLAMLEQLRKQCPSQIDILDVQPNGGKAEAVRRGVLAAMGEMDKMGEIDKGNAAYVGFWDADLATPLSDIPNFVTLLSENHRLQMIFGSRVRLLGRHVHRRAVRHYLGRVFASAVSIALRLPIYDTQCGAKLFRATPELAQVLHDPFLSRWIFDVEILARYIALHKGDIAYLCDSIYEVPLTRWEDVGGSKVRSGDFIKASLDVLRIYRRYIAPISR